MKRLIAGVLTPEQKRKLSVLLVMMFFGSLLEIISIATVMKVCTFFVDENAAVGQILFRFLRHAGIESKKIIMAVCVAALIMLYLFKLVYLLLENRLLAGFVCGVQHRLSSELYEGILRKPYSWFVRLSAADVISLLNTDTGRTGAYLDAFLGLVTEVLVLAVIGALLVYVNPVMTLFLLAGGVLSFFVTRGLIRPSAYRTGRARQAANAKRMKWLNQGVHGIKDIKVRQAEEYFSTSYEREDRVVADCDSRQRSLTKAPGICIESIMVVSVLLYILLLILMEQDMLSYIPNLSAVVAASVRLLPAVRRINGDLIRMANLKSSIQSVADALEGIRKEGAVLPSGPQREADLLESIVVSGLSFAYETQEGQVLNGAGIEIPAGSSVGIVGLSGAGKTTLADILLGLLEPQGGSVTIGGINLEDCRSSYLNQVSYIPQNIFLLDDTVRNNVAFGVSCGEIDDSAVWNALDKACLFDFVKKLPKGLDSLVGENGIRLSGGERQRLGIARALYKGSKLIVFDEATSALDPETEAAVIRSIQGLHGERTMVIISHRASAVAGCDRIYRVEDGCVQEELI